MFGRLFVVLLLLAYVCNATSSDVFPPTGDEETLRMLRRSEVASKLEDYKDKAEDGDVQAQKAVGFLYEIGFKGGKDIAPIKQDDVEALKWYATAAERGDGWAQFKVGECNFMGKGTIVDIKEAVYWYEKSAGNKNPRGQYALAMLHITNVGVEQDLDEAVLLLKEAATKKYGPALVELGKVYEKGFGGRAIINATLALQLYKDALATEDPAALYHMATVTLVGGLVDFDQVKGLEYLEHAAERGSVAALRTLGDLYDGHHTEQHFREDNVKRLKYYSQAVEKFDDAEAMVRLARMAGEGKIEGQRKTKDALMWLLNAATKGHAPAFYYLSEYFGKGLGGVKRDVKEAKRLVFIAASKGIVDAMYTFGSYLIQDAEVLLDKEKAFKEGKAMEPRPLTPQELNIKNREVEAERLSRETGVITVENTEEERKEIDAMVQKFLAQHAKKAEDTMERNPLYESNKARRRGQKGSKSLKVEDPLFEKAESEKLASDAVVEGKSGLEVLKIAYEWLLKAASNGHVEAQGMVGEQYINGEALPQDVKLGLMWMEKSAAKDDVRSLMNLARLYERGTQKGEIERDFRKALINYKQAAINEENVLAKYKTGMLLAEGKGCEEDTMAAAIYFRDAARKGHKDSIYALANLLNRKNIMATNQREAIDWMEKGSKMGIAGCSRLLGAVYEKGRVHCCGIPKDVEKAKHYYLLADKQGDKLALPRYDMMVKATTRKKNKKELVEMRKKKAAEMRARQNAAKNKGRSKEEL